MESDEARGDAKDARASNREEEGCSSADREGPKMRRSLREEGVKPWETSSSSGRGERRMGGGGIGWDGVLGFSNGNRGSFSMIAELSDSGFRPGNRRRETGCLKPSKKHRDFERARKVMMETVDGSSGIWRGR